MSHRPRIVFEDERDSDGFGVIAWIFGFIFFAYAAAVLLCVLLTRGNP